MRSAVSGCALLFAATGWLIMTGLRETPLFWRNAGGYPVGLRMFVLDYYPAITAALLVAGGWRIWSLFRGERPSRATVLLTLLLSILLAVGMGLLIANNVVNLMEGLPLHAHRSGR